jgi:hypothetical protein
MLGAGLLEPRRVVSMAGVSGTSHSRLRYSLFVETPVAANNQGNAESPCNVEAGDCFSHDDNVRRSALEIT